MIIWVSTTQTQITVVSSDSASWRTLKRNQTYIVFPVHRKASKNSPYRNGFSISCDYKHWSSGSKNRRSYSGDAFGRSSLSLIWRYKTAPWAPCVLTCCPRTLLGGFNGPQAESHYRQASHGSKCSLIIGGFPGADLDLLGWKVRMGERS